MNAILALLLALAPAPLAAPDEAERTRIMDEIEQKVRLPMRSDKLEDYARYYTVDENGQVVGRYVIPQPGSPRPGEACEELDLKGKWHKVDCKPYPPWPEGAVAGGRYWVADVGALPEVMDGGCGVVNIRWNPEADEVTARCNGYA